MDKRDEDFLEELTKLTKKHGVLISGCGCCDSPYLVDFDDAVKVGFIEGLEKDIEKNAYYVDVDCGNLKFRRRDEKD